MSESRTFLRIPVLQLGVKMRSGRVYADNAANREAIEKYRERIERGTAFVEFGMPNTDSLEGENKMRRLAAISSRETCAQVTDIREVNSEFFIDVVTCGDRAVDLHKLLDDHPSERPMFGMRSFVKPNQDDAEGVTFVHVASWDFIGTEPVATGAVTHAVPADDVGSIGEQMRAAVQLPDGSGVATGSFDLPADHWVYGSAGEGSGEPPMAMRMGTVSPFRPIFEKAVRQAARYAVRATTQCGQSQQIDPDALVQNMIVGLLGYFTQDGTAGDALSESCEVPRLFAGRLTLPPEQVEEIALANGFTRKPQGEGKPDALHPYVNQYANAIAAAVVQQFIGHLGTAGYLEGIAMPEPYVKSEQAQ